MYEDKLRVQRNISNTSYKNAAYEEDAINGVSSVECFGIVQDQNFTLTQYVCHTVISKDLQTPVSVMYKR